MPKKGIKSRKSLNGLIIHVMHQVLSTFVHFAQVLMELNTTYKRLL